AMSISPNYEEGISPSKLKLIHCAGVGGKTVEVARLEKGLKSKQFGCIKIYLGYVHQYATHPNYHVAYRLARKYKVPVVFHTGDTSTSDALVKYSDPLQIDEIAVQYRDVKFVIAHLGNPWVETAAEVVYKNENVYADVSAFLVGKQEYEPKEQWDEYVVKPIKWAFGFIEDPSKLMYGTDWPLQPMKPYIQAVKKAIPQEHWKDVFYNNALKVYGFEAQGLKPIE
ncbi:MAG TPA: amidohydrolase family protein, partial [Bdellovibrionales bacterium]|nr:amidohydrolase family protein [Bdellovibrionales bacterium]